MQDRHAAELAQARTRVHQAQTAAEEMHRAALAEAATAWARHAEDLAERAGAAREDVQTVTGRVLRADGSSEPYVKLVLSRDVLAGRAVEVRGRPRGWRSSLDRVRSDPSTSPG